MINVIAMRNTPDKQTLLDNGWTIARVQRDGFVKRVFWQDPAEDRQLDQQTALYVQDRRDAAAKRLSLKYSDDLQRTLSNTDLTFSTDRANILIDTDEPAQTLASLREIVDVEESE